MIGPNGIGKSNLLEAVELLGSLRSHRCSNDRDLIQWDAPQALIRADVGDGDRLELELRRQGGVWIVAFPGAGELPLVMEDVRLRAALRDLKWALERGLERILYVDNGAVIGVGIPDTRC